MNNGKFDFVDFGYNYRMSELQAVMGIKQLEKLDAIVTSRLQTKQEYSADLERLGFKAQKVSERVIHNVQSLVFTVPSGTNRNDLIVYLRENGVESVLGTYCLSGTTYYRNKYDTVQENALFLEENTITLPCYDGVDVAYIAGVIDQYYHADR